MPPYLARQEEANSRGRPGRPPALLEGLVGDADTFEVLSGFAPLHAPNDTFPGEVFLHLAADALSGAGTSRAEPLPPKGLRGRFLP